MYEVVVVFFLPSCSCMLSTLVKTWQILPPFTL